MAWNFRSGSVGFGGWHHILSNRPRVEKICKPETKPASPTFACQQISLTDGNMKILWLFGFGRFGALKSWSSLGVTQGQQVWKCPFRLFFLLFARGVFGKDFSLIRKQSVWYSCSGWPFSYWKVGQKGQEIGFQVSFKASIFFWVHLRCPKNSHLKSSNFLRSKPWVGPTRYVHALPGHEWCAVRCWSSSLG